MASYSYTAELEKKVRLQQAQIEALKVERDWLEEDNDLLRAEVSKMQHQEFENLKLKYRKLKAAYFALLDKSEARKKSIEFLIALGREMYNEGQFYKINYHWLLYFYQQLVFELHCRQASSRVDDTAVAVVCSCQRVPTVSLEDVIQETSVQSYSVPSNGTEDLTNKLAVTAYHSCARATVDVVESLEGGRRRDSSRVTGNLHYQDHTSSPAFSPFNIRVYATPSFIRRPRLLRLAFPFAEMEVVDDNSSIENKATVARIHEVDAETDSSGTRLEHSEVTCPDVALTDDHPQLNEAEFSAKAKKVRNN